jgi:hypothetical protein
MKLRMTALLALFAAVAGLGAGAVNVSSFRVNQRICSEKSVYRSGNRVVASLTGTAITNISSSVDAEPKVSEGIVPLCPPLTSCGPDIAPASVEVAVMDGIVTPTCPSMTQCGPNIARPTNVGSRLNEGE